ncbi:hypothetical protein [Curtobacterium sp. MCJR17_043]|uniref:hypothetical protein n=1 Tax=Curtobacterium sp. MCJR17_043 TaxID=2175660 RepID=UPI0032E8D4CA
MREGDTDTVGGTGSSPSSGTTGAASRSTSGASVVGSARPYQSSGDAPRHVLGGEARECGRRLGVAGRDHAPTQRAGEAA